jgi:ferric-dicitrate binding protein FerR (iron transport regulator)
MLGAMGREEMRAGDSDRQAVAEALEHALDEGRLDLAEYDERLQRAYAAKTYGDLEGLLDDLPATAVTPTPAPAPQRAAAPPQRRAAGQLVRAWLGGFGGVFVLCTVIWLATSIGSGQLQYFWPVWLLIPMAFGAIGHFRGDHRRD